jgi:hypothetical protein
MLATACGYSFDQIDAMTMDQFTLLCDYWRDRPPLHMLAAAYLGIKQSSNRPAPAGDLIRLLGADPERGGQMRL